MPDERELAAVHDRRASFYGKARVRTDDCGNRGLLSYGVPVCWMEKAAGRLHRVWSGWSATTGRHVNEFAVQATGMPLCKKEWDAMPVEPAPPFLS